MSWFGDICTKDAPFLITIFKLYPNFIFICTCASLCQYLLLTKFKNNKYIVKKKRLLYLAVISGRKNVKNLKVKDEIVA